MYSLQAINMSFFLITKKNSNSLHTRKIADKNDLSQKPVLILVCTYR